MNSTPLSRNVMVFALGGIWFLFMAISTISGRLLIEVDGDILNREITSGNRPAAIYTVRDPNGQIRRFISGCTDSSLPRNLPLGSHIAKQKWNLAYNLNGVWISDFPIYFYIIILAIGTGLLWFGIVTAIQVRRQ